MAYFWCKVSNIFMKEKATQCKDSPISREQHPIKTAINVFYLPRGQAVTQKQRFRRRQLSLGSGRVGKVSMLAAKLTAVNFQRRSKKLALTQRYLKILLSAQTHDVAPDDEFPHSSNDCFHSWKARICFVQLKPVQGLRLVPVPLLSLRVQNDCCVLNSNRGKMLAGNGSGKCIWGNKDMLMRKTVRSDEGKKKDPICQFTERGFQGNNWSESLRSCKLDIQNHYFCHNILHTIKKTKKTQLQVHRAKCVYRRFIINQLSCLTWQFHNVLADRYQMSCLWNVYDVSLQRIAGSNGGWQVRHSPLHDQGLFSIT